MFKAIWGQHFTRDRCAWVVANPGVTRSLVCFSEELPFRNWTYFEVVRLNREGRSVLVRPVAGPLQELLDQYDLREFNLDDLRVLPN